MFEANIAAVVLVLLIILVFSGIHVAVALGITSAAERVSVTKILSGLVLSPPTVMAGTVSLPALKRLPMRKNASWKATAVKAIA